MKQVFRKFNYRASASSVLRLVAYALPILALLVVLYLNYLPFGYDRTFAIVVGSPSDGTGQFAIKSYGDGLSKRMTTASGTPYRTLQGSAYAIYTPKAYLRSAIATITVDAPGIAIIPPNIDFKPSSTAWDYTLPQEPGSSSCLAFDGATQMPLPGTSSLFDDPERPFSVYVEWTPQSDKDGFQQIVGHHDWELLQNKDDVKFQIGSTSIKQPIDDSTFYGQPHTALAVYVPATSVMPDGHIDLYVDNAFSGRTYFLQSANRIPEATRDLTLGKSDYGEASFFIGCISDMRIARQGIDPASDHATFAITREKKSYPIALIALGRMVTLTDIRLHVVQK